MPLWSTRSAVVDVYADVESPPLLLDDEQVREFIASGLLRLTPDVDPAVHEQVDALLRHACERETWYGNNILARVPKMHAVLDCPVVRGALISLLGEGYFLHPHRAVHTSTPVDLPDMELLPETDAPPMGKGSAAGSGWHQDAQSPLARARHHVPRYLIGFYFPHAVPVAMGATRVQAGSHLYAHPVQPSGVVLEDIPAGAFYLLHFDMVHAGFPNRTERTRYMVKFVFTRTRPPRAPSWNHADPTWRRPQASHRLPDFDLPATWGYIWNWMRGEPAVAGAAGGREIAGAAGARESARAAGGRGEASATPSNETPCGFGDARQPARLEAIYRGTHSTDSLRTALLAHAGQDKHERVLLSDAEGRPQPRDDVRGFPRCWNERAVVMEDAGYALAAQGTAAIPALLELLEHADPWMRINAAFALGELGLAARSCVPALARRLRSPHQQEVRQSLDALAAIGCDLTPALPAIESLLTKRHPCWQEPQVMRGWTAQDQVRLNAAFVLLSGATASEDCAEIERIAAGVLGDANGYVSAVAAGTLTRIGTPSATATALRFLAERRWDDTLMGRAKAY